MKKLILTIALIYPWIASAQTQIKLDDELTRQISNTENHHYQLYLEESQIAFLTFNQMGVDIAISAFDTNGKKMGEFDSPNGRFGPEMVTITSTKKGFYSFHVASIDSKEQSGAYKLQVRKVVKKAVTKFDQVDQVFLPWDNEDSPGAAVAIIQNGSVIYQNTYGVSNLEYNLPITEKSAFLTGSIGKQFTAFAIMLLEEEGKLSLDDDLRKYIPEIPDFGQVITLRHLANHTSGLREEAVLAALMGWLESDVVTTEQILKVLGKQKALNFTPGDQYMYCNTGYTLLAEVVARVSGKSFVEYTKENIFEPLKMHNSTFIDDHQTIIINKAYAYYTDGNGYRKSVLNEANPGSSGLYTTIEDLSLWVLNYEKQLVGSAEIFEKMGTVGILNNGEKITYGLGTERSIYKGLSEIGHGGSIGGYKARITRFPDQDFSVIVLANVANIHPQTTPNKIVDIFMAEHFLPVKENETTHQISERRAIQEQVSAANPDLNVYVGKYYSEELSMEYVFELKDNKLHLNHPRIEMHLSPIGKDVFEVDGWGQVEITFTRNQKNEILGFRFSMVNVKNIQFIKR